VSHTNRLQYGDNLDVLRRHVDDDPSSSSVLDLSFNSNANYRCSSPSGKAPTAASQIKAFEDTLSSDDQVARAFDEVVEAGGSASQEMQAVPT